MRSLRSADAARQSLRVGGAAPVLGLEAKEAEDTQVIFGDAVGGTADEPDALTLHIGVAAKRIVDGAVAIGIERVHREVAPPGIRLPIVGKGDLGLSPESLDVDPERRHLEGPTVGNNGDRPMVDAGRMHAQAGAFGGGCDVGRRERRREIDVGHGDAEDGVAHRTAGDARRARLVQDVEHATERGLPQPAAPEAGRRPAPRHGTPPSPYMRS